MQSRINKIGLKFRSKLKSFFELISVLFVPKSHKLRILMGVILLLAIFGYGSWAYATFTGQIMQFFNWILYAINVALGYITMKIFALIVIVSSYNDFVNSAAVTKGWVLVRDICNMLFVFLLLMIAFAQIFNVQKYNVKTLLPKVIIAAILVNFSKLISGLIIDFGQVVMMTFVNGYKATAGANLIKGLGLDAVMKYANEADTKGELDAQVATNVFVALFLSMVMLLVTIVITAMILVLFLIRIVTLWILVVLSPIAFLGAAVPIGGFQSKASEWWKNFGGAVAVGPLMAFFLWLSLLIMSNPQEMFKSDTSDIENKSQGGFVVSEISYLDNLGQFAIGMALLFAGLAAAKQTGGLIGSVAGKTDASLRKAGTKALISVAKSPYRVPAAAGRQIAKTETYGRARDMVAQTALKTKAEVKKRAVAGVAGFAAQRAGSKSELAVAMGKATEASIKASGGGLLAQKWKGAQVRRAVGRVQGKRAAEEKYKFTTVGAMDELAADKIGKERHKKELDKAQGVLSARGLKSPDEFRELLMNGSADKHMRKAAGMKLADNGDFSSRAQADEALKLVGGDKDAKKAMTKSMKTKQAHFAYDLENADEAKRQKAEQALSNDIATGDVEMKTQQVKGNPVKDKDGNIVIDPKTGTPKTDVHSALGDSNFQRVYKEAVGPNKYKEDVLKASKRSEMARTEVEKSITANAKTDIPELRAFVKEITKEIAALKTSGKTAEAKEMEVRLKDSPQMKKLNATQTLLNKTTGDLGKAYGSRNSAGEVQPGGAIDAGTVASLQSDIKKMSGKDLGGIKKMEGEILAKASEVVTTRQLSKVAASDESGAAEVLDKLVGSIQNFSSSDSRATEANESKKRQIAGNDSIMDALSPELRSVFEKYKKQPTPREAAPAETPQKEKPKEEPKETASSPGPRKSTITDERGVPYDLPE